MTITICCACKSAIKLDKIWHKVSVEDVEFLERENRTHGYCPECLIEAKAKLEAMEWKSKSTEM